MYWIFYWIPVAAALSEYLGEEPSPPVSMKEKVSSVKCRVLSVECQVSRAKCNVQRVKCNRKVYCNE